MKKKISKKKAIHKPYGTYEAYIKRPLDAFFATGALFVFSPVMVVIGILIRMELGKPVIFTQERPGMKVPGTGNERIFKLYKFRTMKEEKDDMGKQLPDEERLTELGRKLRSISLDELPELINIIRGDMALVGPRPLLVEYLSYYENYEKHRHDVRPGLTGLAQINGRNALGWEKRFQYDVEYVNHITFLSDLKIIIKTVLIVLQRKGITSETSVTMEPFIRNDKSIRQLGK